ncbi:hypothetical protein GCM10027074_09320 [Streptomyces deserti]
MTASRNLADGPDASSRYTGGVATLPTAHTIVSFIANPSLARAARLGRIRVRARPVRLRLPRRPHVSRTAAVTATASVAIAARPDCLRRAEPAERCGPPPTCGKLRHPNE